MLEGPKILFRVALGIIFYFESELVKMQSLEQVMGLLKAKLALLVSSAPSNKLWKYSRGAHV